MPCSARVEHHAPKRVDQLGVAEPEIQRSGTNQITVGLPAVTDFARAEKQVGTTAQLSFYDWEANVLTPNGKTVRRPVAGPRTRRHSRSARGRRPAVRANPARAACRSTTRSSLPRPQPAQNRVRTTPRLGPEYYMFAAPGSAACRDPRRRISARRPWSVSTVCSPGPTSKRSDLLSGLPAGVTAEQAQELVVTPGTVRGPGPPTRAPSKVTQFTDASARFYVLKDHAALLGTEDLEPHAVDRFGRQSRRHVSRSAATGGSKFQTVTRDDRPAGTSSTAASARR